MASSRLNRSFCLYLLIMLFVHISMGVGMEVAEKHFTKAPNALLPEAPEAILLHAQPGRAAGLATPVTAMFSFILVMHLIVLT